MNASRAIPGIVCSTPTARVTLSAARERLSARPRATPASTAASIDALVSQRCRALIDAIAARRLHRSATSDVSVRPPGRAPPGAVADSTSPSSCSASVATVTTGAPSTSTRAFHRRMRTTSMRPLSRVSAATTSGRSRAMAPRTIAAAS